MARTTHVVTVDDFDGTEDAQTVSFALHGTEYTIDLTDEHRAELEEALTPFIEVATKVGKGRRKSASTAPKSNAAEVRAWAKENGYDDVPARGRVPLAVVEAYEAR